VGFSFNTSFGSGGADMIFYEFAGQLGEQGLRPVAVRCCTGGRVGCTAGEICLQQDTQGVCAAMSLVSLCCAAC
jgi:hypothetical protein